MRFTRLSYCVVAGLLMFAAAVPVHASSSVHLSVNKSASVNKIAAMPLSTPAVVAHTRLGTDSLSTVRAALPVPHHTPSPLPLAALAIGAVVTSTRRSRRKDGERPGLPLLLDSDVHVMRKNDETGKPETTVITGGILVDDTDLTDDEVDELTARRVIRYATTAEVERLERRAAEAEAAKVQQRGAMATDALGHMGDEERRAIVARHDAEKAQELAELDAKQAAKRDELQAAVADESAKASTRGRGAKPAAASTSTGTPPAPAASTSNTPPAPPTT